MMAAGWLFADLLLVLFVIGWGTESSAAQTPSIPPTSPLPTPISSPSPSPSPTPTPTAPPGLAKEPVVLTLSVNLDGDRLADPSAVTRDIGTLVEALGRPGDQAGMVLVWGYSNDVDHGMKIAESVAQLLISGSEEVFENATTRNFWKGGQSGRVDLEVYLLAK